ncbi:VCBS repeat protein [Actinocorallia herbida]|uniref:VCBS repeat protein n=1 Tax=Actinocorallia herbida TaxID=58109 RepID=A0A3N1D944_9ACTN|nr:VCBS repeat-containing protein [Actinocorallia herbida]ROO90045.1 VCBS repeat protein [Actinocorallia herbida]
MRHISALLTGVLLAAALPGAAASAAARPAKPGDFDGDGRGDLVVLSPSLRKGKGPLGVVTVRYGDGKVRHLSTRKGTTPAETSVSADFDRDGYADLATTGKAARGVTVVYGSAKGLSGRRAHLPVPHATPGAARLLAAGDFDGNGRPDLVATAGADTRVFLDVRRGAPRANTEFPGESACAVTPVAADVTGDGFDDLYLADRDGDDLLFRGGRRGFGTPVRTPQYVTWTAPVTAATGDFDNDGHADIALQYGGDTVEIRHGHSGGLHTVRHVTGEEIGFPGKPLTAHPESSLAVGDVDRDGRDDLVLGQPGGGPQASGRVVVLYSAENGIRIKDPQAFHQGQAALHATPRGTDRFGSAVALVDFSGGRSPELVVAAAGEQRLYVLRNTGKRFTSAEPGKIIPAAWGLSGASWAPIMDSPA